MRPLIFLLYFMGASFAHGVLAGGRPNAISGGKNAFAGVVNPANAVWIEDRLDMGMFLVYQKSSLDNRDNNPLLPPGKIDLNYKVRYLFTADMAIHKRVKEMSFSLATYSTPSEVKLRTKMPFPSSGTTPIRVENKVQAVSFIFSFKIHPRHSIGFSLDYFYLTHLRNGYQRADNPLRSVSPGHVTNNGRDHSGGLGLGVGWRWNITKKLMFGIAWVKKSNVGQYRKYRGYEPRHAKNYIPETAGGGFTYLFNPRLAGRLEIVWTNLGNLPGANNNIVHGQLNLNKRGSDKSPGPGLQDATFLNLGLGYKLSEFLSIGTGLSHRFKLRKSSNFLSHTYTLQTIYDILAFGADFSYQHHEVFLSISYGFNNRISGNLPIELGGGKIISKKSTTSLSFAWGYKY